MVNNFYLGSEEYIILFKNGTHHIFNCWEHETYENAQPLYTGNYEECLEYEDIMKCAYNESLI